MRFTYFIFCPSLSSETFFWCAASSAVISLISPQREIRVVSSHHSHVRIYMLCSTASMLVEFSDTRPNPIPGGLAHFRDHILATQHDDTCAGYLVYPFLWSRLRRESELPQRSA